VRAHGGPLIRVKRADLTRAGVEQVPERTAGVRDGLPVLDGGRVHDVRQRRVVHRVPAGLLLDRPPGHR
jgi:hypothetical protein